MEKRFIFIFLFIFGVLFQIFRHDYEFVVANDIVYRCHLRTGEIDKAACNGATFRKSIGFR